MKAFQMVVYISCVVLLYYSAPVLADLPASGEAACPILAGNDGCRMSWNLSATPRPYYRVQHFDSGRGSWKTRGPSYSDPYSTSDETINKGGLYRVAACDDKHASENCLYSTVYWVSFVLEPADIPSGVNLRNADGTKQRAQISLDAPLHSRLIQYNVYQMVNVANHLVSAGIPDMTKPVHPVDTNDATVDHLINESVFDQYTKLQEQYSND
jgi:hypothetical protein